MCVQACTVRGLGHKVGAALLSHVVDGAALLELDDSDLKNVGILRVGERKTLLRAIKALQENV